MCDVDLTDLDIDEHEPVARQFSSEIKNARRHGHKDIKSSEWEKVKNPNTTTSGNLSNKELAMYRR